MIVLLADGTALLVVGDARAIEEPVGRALRELGITQKALSDRCGISQPELSKMRRGLEPCGEHRIRRLATACGINFAQPQWHLRCGLWIRSGNLDSDQRSALRREVDRRRRQLTRSRLGGRHNGEFVPREPSQRVGPSGGYIPLTYRSMLSPRATRGLSEWEERATGGDA